MVSENQQKQKSINRTQFRYWNYQIWVVIKYIAIFKRIKDKLKISTGVIFGNIVDKGKSV